MGAIVNNENTKIKAEAYQIAHMYYELGMLQPEIAESMYISRSKVSRLLKYARETGLVEITVKRVLDRVAPLEELLCDLFHLDAAVVVANCDSNIDELLENVTTFAAFYVSKLLSGNYTLGITSGHSINKVISKLTKLNDCQLNVVQTMGSSTSSYLSDESHTLVNSILNKFNGTGFFLNTPLYIDDLYVKGILMQDNSIQAVFQQMQNCDMILTGIGSIESDDDIWHSWHGYMTKRHISELRRKNAVGSICAQYFDTDGVPITCEWNTKCIAMPLADIPKCKNVIGVACGSQKDAAISAALRGRLINILITDAQTATRVIHANESLLQARHLQEV